ncbi:MAG: rubredoxin-like domain-containing protein [Candidatus Hydrothermarchaeota archaeon]
MWRCTVCGYVSSGSEPPERCPRCQAPKKKFEEVQVKRRVAEA